MVDEKCGEFALAARASLRLRTALVATPGFSGLGPRRRKPSAGGAHGGACASRCSASQPNDTVLDPKLEIDFDRL